MYLHQIPGFIRARDRADKLEDYWRHRAFLDVTETLRFAGGFTIEVKQLTLRMFIQLCAMRSPFFVSGHVGPEHVAQLLWRISPEYDDRLKVHDARLLYVEKIASIPYANGIRTVDRYLDRQLLDKPPVRVRLNDGKSDTSFAAGMIHTLATAYGWSGEEILDLPIARLFQYLRRIRRAEDPKFPMWNPIRDKLTRKITVPFLQKRKEARTNGGTS